MYHIDKGINVNVERSDFFMTQKPMTSEVLSGKSVFVSSQSYTIICIFIVEVNIKTHILFEENLRK